MKPFLSAIGTALLAFGVLCPCVSGSDHADPQTLNIFQPQSDPIANITDLHAFLADKDGRPLLEDPTIKDAAKRKADAASRIAQADQLIISLCVLPRLLPDKSAGLKDGLPKYAFRVHLDLNPELRHFDPRLSDAAIRELDDEIKMQTEERDRVHKSNPPSMGGASQEEMDQQKKLIAPLEKRGLLYAQRQQDRTMEQLYGGIIDRPETIAEDAMLDFHLALKSDGTNSQVIVATPQVEGIPGRINLVTDRRVTLNEGKILVEKHDFMRGAINVQGGFFDDPFIFPRFFRLNVIGIVISIPLDSLHRPDGTSVRGHPILLWATSHKADGSVIDHVGRSLRTQLPRFGYLNQFHPSRHVAEIMRVHAEPTLMENGLATFLAPLEAHRHYDSAPDVMVFDLARPARFPNGRWLADDISKILAEAGETLLYELSCSDSRQSPRATTNDKPFYSTFPYLASPWDHRQIQEHAFPGVKFGDFNLGDYNLNEQDKKIPGTYSALFSTRVPDAPDSGATAMPDLNPKVWASLFCGVALLLGLAMLLVFLAVRSPLAKFLVLAAGAAAFCYLKGGSGEWLRWLAALIVLVGGLIACLTFTKLLQKLAVLLIVVAVLCALWPAWWICVWPWYLLLVTVLVGGAFFGRKDPGGRLIVCILGVAALWIVWQSKPVVPAHVAAPVPLMAPPNNMANEKLFRLIFSGGFIAAFGLLALYGFGVRRGIRRATPESIPPPGDQRPVTEDYQYDGSTFSEVRDAVLGNPYYGSVWGEPGQKPLPVYPSSFASVAEGLFSLSKRFFFLDAARRTVESHADLRWGRLDVDETGVEHKKGVKRIIHRNGVCLAGVWRITEDTPYTGFFAKGSEGLVVARYSSGLGVRRGQKRTLSMVGKLYPTTRPDERHRSASFITQEDLGAAYSEGIHESLLRNAPNVTINRRFPDFGTLFLFAFTFFRADMRNSIRQLYEIAELGKAPGVKTNCPQFMQLRVISARQGGGEETADFRDEVLAQIYDRGTPGKQRDLVFEIAVSDTGKVGGFPDKSLIGADWRRIGTITFDEAAASYNGDFVIHFHHPKWRNDVNDPNSESGPGRLARTLNAISDKISKIAGFFVKQD